MFTGQFAVISRNATWLSKTVDAIDEDGDQADLADGHTDAIEITIRDEDDCILLTASLDNGKAALSSPSPAGVFWQFEVSDLQRLCVGSYRLIVLITRDGFVSEVANADLGVTD